VARTFLNDPVASAEYEVRAVTRDPTSAAALALAKLGATLIKVSLLFYSSFKCF